MLSTNEKRNPLEEMNRLVSQANASGFLGSLKASRQERENGSDFSDVVDRAEEVRPDSWSGLKACEK